MPAGIELKNVRSLRRLLEKKSLLGKEKLTIGQTAVI